MLTLLIKRICLPALLWVGFSLQALTQNPQELTLEGAREYALEHNKNLINAGLGMDEASLMLRETIAGGLPQVEATIDYNNFFGSSVDVGALPGFEIEFNPTSNLNVSASQLLFSGSYIVGVQMSRLYRDVTRASYDKTETEIKASVTQAYILCLIAEQSLTILEANLENMEGLLEKTRALVRVGVAEELDYDQLTVQAATLNDARRAAERQVELAYNMLRLQMGVKANTPMTLTNTLEQLVDQADISASMHDSFQMQQNPDFRQMEIHTQIARKQINTERAAYLPTLVGFYNFTEKIKKPEFDMTPSHVVGLNLSIPIFSSGARRARVQQAKVNFEVAHNQKELLTQQLMIQETQLRYNLSNAFEQYESQKNMLHVARRVFENITRKYQQGLVSSLDLTTANSNFLQAENNFTAALMQLLEAQIELDKLLNRL